MSERQSFWVVISTVFLVLLLPVGASAQYRDLDVAMANLERGFGSGDAQAIVSGMASGAHIQLQFPGLIDQTGFFGRDQAAYLLDGLFNKVRPSGFERLNARKSSAEGQYHITARWTINAGTVNLYITLRQRDTGWSVVSAALNLTQKMTIATLSLSQALLW